MINKQEKPFKNQTCPTAKNVENNTKKTRHSAHTAEPASKPYNNYRRNLSHRRKNPGGDGA